MLHTFLLNQLEGVWMCMTGKTTTLSMVEIVRFKISETEI